MDHAYLILITLFLMGLIGFISVVLPDGSLVTSSQINAKLRLNGYDGVLYDSGGHGVCFYNMSAVGEAGHVVFYNWGSHGAYWRNGSLGVYLLKSDLGLVFQFLYGLVGLYWLCVCLLTVLI